MDNDTPKLNKLIADTMPQPGDTLTIYAAKLEPHHLIVGIADGQDLIGISFPVEQVIDDMTTLPELLREPGRPYIYLTLHSGLGGDQYAVALRGEVKITITI